MSARPSASQRHTGGHRPPLQPVQLERQLNGAKWPLLLPLVSSQLRPNACRWLVVAFARARREFAGCMVLSIYSGSAGFATLGTPSHACSSILGMDTDRRSPSFL